MKAAYSYDCGRNYTSGISALRASPGKLRFPKRCPSDDESKITPGAYTIARTSTEVMYGGLNNKVERRCIETVNLTRISVELDSSAPCALA